MKGKKPTYEELEKNLADARARVAGLQDEVDAIKNERDTALLGSRDLEEAYIESEQNFRNSLDACPLGVRIVTENSELIYANPAMLDILGYRTFEELKDVPPQKFYSPESYRQYLEWREERQRGESVPQEYEVTIRRPDGEVKTLNVFRREVIWGGERQFMAMYHDITESKRAEEALRQSQEMFARAFYTSPNLMVISTLNDGRIVEINETYCHVTGYKREELIGHTTLEINVWNIPEQRGIIIRKLEKEGQVDNIEAGLRTKSGEIRFIVFSMAPITLNDEPCLITIASDITERKRLEDNLKKEQQEIRTIIDSAPILIFYKDKEGKFLRINKAFAIALDNTNDAIVGKTVFDLYSADIAQGMTDDDREVLESGHPKLNIIEQYESAGGLRWVQTDKVPILDDKGIPAGLIGFAQDITERKQMEEALRFSDAAFKSMHESVIAVDNENNITYWNNITEQLFGIKASEVMGKNLFKIIVPVGQYPGQYRELVRKLQEQGYNREDLLFNSPRGPVWVDMSIQVIEKDVKKYGYVITSLDITGRKQAEEQLKESEEFNSNLLTNTPNAIFVTYPDGAIKYVNPAFEKLTGFSLAEIIGMKNPYPWWLRDKKDEIEASLKETAPGEGINLGERLSKQMTFQKKNGELFTVELNAAMINKDGQREYILVTWNDITERKRAEEALRESEEKFSNAFNSSTNAICIMSLPDNRYIEVNESYCRLTGYSREEIIGRTTMELGIWAFTEDREQVQNMIEKEGKFTNFEFHSRMKSGEIRIGLSSAEIISIAGKPCRIVMITEITELKKAEEALKDSEEKFSKAFSTSGNAISIVSLQDNRFIEINEAFLRFTGYTREEIIGHSAVELNLWVINNELQRFLGELEEKGKFYNQEFRSRRKSGEIRIALGSAEVINIGGKPCRIVMITDITELKKAEEALKDSEEKFSKAFSTSGNAISIVSLQDNRFIEINEAFLRFTGYTREEIIGHTGSELNLSVSDEELTRWNVTIRKGDRVFNHEFNSRMKTGEIRTGLASGEVINIGGKPCRIVVITDITERKKAEEALRKSEENFRRSLDESPLGIRIVNSDDETIYANRAIVELFGYASFEEFKSIPRKMRYTPESYAEYLARKEKRDRGGEALLPIETTIIRKDGEIRHIETLRKEVLWNGERQYQLISQDFTERKKAEVALRKSEENFRRSLDESPLGIRVVNSDDETIYANRTLLDIYGYASIEELKSVPVEKHFTPEMYQEFQLRKSKRNWGEPQLERIETVIIRKDGEIRHLENLRKEVLWNGEKQYQVLHQDITERKQDEERINHLNLTLRSIRYINQLITREKNRDNIIRGVCDNLVESRSCNSAWIGLFDESRKLTAWAQRGFRVGFSSLLESINQGKLPACVQKAMKQRRVIVTEDPPKMCTECPVQAGIPNTGAITVRLEHKGKIYGILCTSMPKLLLHDKDETSLFQDVAADIAFALHGIELGAERDLLVQERLQAAKLESIGTLAGGIAHDFNNLLTGIMGNIGLAKTYLKPSDKTYEMVDEAEKAAVRARDLTHQLLTFARGGKPVKKSVQIADLINESATFALRGSKAKLELFLSDDLRPVEADEGQISQVIHNLVINADEAMPAGGILKIEAANFAVRKTGTLPLARGNYVQIDIRDTGVGIPEEHLQRIFEPYFTTKQRGSGLGLPTVYSIIKNHGGYIFAESVLNKGSVFHIYLPASKKTIKPEKKSAAAPSGRAGGKVLVMDDQESIRKMLKNILDLVGYQTELTCDGAEALEKYAQALKSGEPFNAVIMDLTIPGGMGGKEAIKKLLAIDPDARVVVSSGYATDPIMSEYKKYGFSAVITKPYSVKQLEETLLGLSRGK